MPMISVKWVADGRTKAMRDKIAAGITQSVHDATGVPKTDIWVAFEDISGQNFYTQSMTVASQRAAAKKKSAHRKK